MIKNELLLKTIQDWADIPPEQWSELLPRLKERKISKGDYFLKAGDLAVEIGFLITGYCRQFYTNGDHQEFNHSFVFENELMGGYPSLLRKSPSTYSIQAMEDCDLLVINWDEFESFFNKHICWERLVRKVAEKNYLQKIQRESAFLLKDARERYLEVCEYEPEVIERVPQYHLASYLGITASALNRIIKKIEKE
jgi:CRP-like cAMP-binding protein